MGCQAHNLRCQPHILWCRSHISGCPSQIWGVSPTFRCQPSILSCHPHTLSCHSPILRCQCRIWGVTPPFRGASPVPVPVPNLGRGADAVPALPSLGGGPPALAGADKGPRPRLAPPNQPPGPQNLIRPYQPPAAPGPLPPPQTPKPPKSPKTPQNFPNPPTPHRLLQHQVGSGPLPNPPNSGPPQIFWGVGRGGQAGVGSQSPSPPVQPQGGAAPPPVSVCPSELGHDSSRSGTPSWNLGGLEGIGDPPQISGGGGEGGEGGWVLIWGRGVPQFGDFGCWGSPGV